MSGDREEFSMRPPRVLLGAMEAAANRVLHSDPDIAPKVRRLHGKVMQLHISGLGVRVFVLVSNGNIIFFDDFGGDADVCLSAPPLSLLRMGLEQRQGKSIMGNADVLLEGDMQIAQQFQSLIAALELDWEELLAQRVGDIAARQVGLMAEGFGRWLRRSHTSVDMALRDYIQEEVQHSPTAIEVSNLADDIDNIRMDVDRLEARIQRLHVNKK
jgi:ubiquinone biosynthesis protein UbiJ